MANQKLKLTDKVDAFTAWFWIVLCAAPVIWCAHTGTSFDYIMSLALGVVVWVVFLSVGWCLFVAIVVGILGGGGK